MSTIFNLEAIVAVAILASVFLVIRLVRGPLPPKPKPEEEEEIKPEE